MALVLQTTTKVENKIMSSDFRDINKYYDEQGFEYVRSSTGEVYI
jgi:hypothetical protein